jgi:hypothetical protein
MDSDKENKNHEDTLILDFAPKKSDNNAEQTDFNDDSTLIKQLLSIIPKNEFNILVNNYNTEFASKGFSSWDHYIILIFAQLTLVSSLREIIQLLTMGYDLYKQILIDKIPSINTISYANSHRDWRLFKSSFDLLSDTIKTKFSNDNLKFDFNVTYIDPSILSLLFKIFDFNIYTKSKGGLVLQQQYHFESYMPCFIIYETIKNNNKDFINNLAQDNHFSNLKTITNTDIISFNVSDLPKNTFIVIDSNYTYTSLLHNFNNSDISFISGPVTNLPYEIVENRPLPENSQYTIEDVKTKEVYLVVSDSYIKLKHPKSRQEYPKTLRLVTIRSNFFFKNEKNFLTNNIELSADTIATVYNERLRIHNFLKTLKQMGLKSFLGSTENAINSQIWAGMSALMLVKCLQLMSKKRISFSRLFYILNLNLFACCDLYSWVNNLR